jgi:glycosyltransferase involved in cell wall biosynthesis
VTTAPPPEQLAAVVDDVEVAPAAPPGSRAVIELQRIADNASVREATLRLAPRLKPDFVYQRHRPLFAVGPDVAAAAGVPLVLEWNASEQWKRRHWESRGPLDWVFDGLVARMEEATLRRSDLVVAVSRRAADMAVEYGAPAERVITVPNAVRFDQRPPDAAPEPSHNGAATVGWIGTFGPWHGAEVLIGALPHLDAGVRLRMIGDGTGRDGCRRLARDLGVDERIEWTGALPHPDALAALARCDVLASPHLTLPDRPFFGSPMKIFEYMALGRPIVASRLEQLDEILDDGRTARLVTPGDAEELAGAIEQVLASPDRGQALGRAALEEARREHTWAQRAESVLRGLEG